MTTPYSTVIPAQAGIQSLGPGPGLPTAGAAPHTPRRKITR